MSRNSLASSFLASDCDTFIGIDDDVGITPDVLQIMLAKDVNFIGAYLPQRTINLKAFASAIRQGQSIKAAQYQANPYVGPAFDGLNLNGPQTLEVDRIGTGFYILRRTVLEEIIRLNFSQNENVSVPNTNTNQHGFFNNIVSQHGYLSEDYSFCHRVKAADFKIHAYFGPGVSHTGSTTFFT